jgi:hypothetical protein
MNKLVRTASAVVLAATVAGALTILPGFSDPVDASAPIMLAIAAAPVPVASDQCAEQHWPYIAAGCLRDGRKADGQARAVARVVNIDRKMAAQ